MRCKVSGGPSLGHLLHFSPAALAGMCSHACSRASQQRPQPCHPPFLSLLQVSVAAMQASRTGPTHAAAAGELCAIFDMQGASCTLLCAGIAQNRNESLLCDKSRLFAVQRLLAVQGQIFFQMMHVKGDCISGCEAAPCQIRGSTIHIFSMVAL